MTEEDFNNENLHEQTAEIVDEFALAKHSAKHKRLERKTRKKQNYKTQTTKIKKEKIKGKRVIEYE